MKIDAYLERIGYHGPLHTDERTLVALHRRHLHAIPYENFDVQLGREVTLELEDAYRKLVVERRGGWCYEMNGLLAWALREIGFDVTPLAAGVLRETFGDRTLGGHLALLIQLDRPWFADVGFGDGLVEPIPLSAAEIVQGPLRFELTQLDERYWRFHNHPEGGAASFDFALDPARPEMLSRNCRWLQTAAESPFVQNAVCEIHTSDGLMMLRGRVLKSVTLEGVQRRSLADIDEYAGVLREVFKLELSRPEVERVWDRMTASDRGRLAGA